MTPNIVHIDMAPAIYATIFTDSCSHGRLEVNILIPCLSSFLGF